MAGDVSKAKGVLKIAGWILLGAVVGGVASNVIGPDEEALRVTPVVVTVLVTPAAATTASVAAEDVAKELATPKVVVTESSVERNGSGGSAPKVVVKNYGMRIMSGPGSAYSILGHAIMGREYRIEGRNQAGDWWKIDFVDSRGKEAQGWLYAPFETTVNADLVGVVEAPPTPTIEVSTTRTPGAD